ncbi:MAG: alpha/beta hydrolase family protein, partial [Solirubrobacteraceae bacterium]
MAPRDVRAFFAGLSDWASAKGRAPHTHRYGGPEHEADLLMPDGERPHRVAVLLHGGFWRARFTRATMAALAVDLADRGWGTWNVEYRRVGSGGGGPETLDDVRAAIDALTSVEAPLDLARLVVIGHSAG